MEFRRCLFRSDPEIEELADLKGKLPNSASRTWTAGAGASLITDGGNLGVSFSRYDSLYGVPNRYSVEPEDHDHEEEGEEEHHEQIGRASCRERVCQYV